MGASIFSCNISTLDPYVPSSGNPWNFQKVQHAYKRLSFGASALEVDTGLGQISFKFYRYISKWSP